VGLGGYSTGELGPALKNTQYCHLTGVVTGSKEKGRAWASEYGFSESNVFLYQEIGRLATASDVDIVYVVTPNFLHSAHVIAAAHAGKHVISEKPFTTSVPEAEAAISACREAKVKLSIGYRLHFDPYHCELIRLAQDKTFGGFARARGGHSFVMGQKTWRTERAMAGGGPLVDVGIYVIQAACMAAGGVAPIAVTAVEGPKTRPDLFADIEESMRWTMEFANGSTSYVQEENWFDAQAQHGWLDLDSAFSTRGLSGSTNYGPLNYSPPIQQALQMDDFALCIIRGRESRVCGEMGLRDMKIIAAIYEAARSKKRVEVAI
jgi:glucose-fructose oxidoreductase